MIKKQWNKTVCIWILSGLLLTVCPSDGHAQKGKWLSRLFTRKNSFTTAELLGNSSDKLGNFSLEMSVFSKVQQAQLDANGGHGPLLRSTFRARVNRQEENSIFSGTVFKISYHGQEEIYGVIAAHAVGINLNTPLAQNFVADIYTPQGMRTVPAQIVQISAPSMLDMALVKFRPEDEKLFTPLTLAHQRPQVGQLLQTQGFARGKEVFLPDRTLQENAGPALRTQVPIPYGQRNGLCGSALTNEQYELVGIYTGSACGLAGDVSYAMPASFLSTLVDAYHGHSDTFPFILNGRMIMPLKVDEYISEVRLADRFDNQQAYLRFGYKLSYSTLLEQMELHNPRYLNFVVRKVKWIGRRNARHLEEDREHFWDAYTIYTYDTSLKKIISEKNKMWWNNWL